MDFVFENPEKIDLTTLQQGDLLVRNSRLADAIRAAHAYYADAADYSHFLVLTQSCDLVRRDGRPPKSRYITIAAARPLQLVIARFLEKHAFNGSPSSLLVCQKDREAYAKQLLERLLHNTEDGYFFIRKDSVPSVTEDLCVFLPLSIALRADHYEACLAAKVGQLAEIFSAKVGWLAGNQYSRVATPDIEEHIDEPEKYKNNFYQEVLYDQTAWLSPPQYRKLREAIARWRKQNGGIEPDRDTILALVASLPNNLEMIAERVVNVLLEGGALAKDKITPEATRLLLVNDVALQKLVRITI
jgi:hypothetical protein